MTFRVAAYAWLGVLAFALFGALQIVADQTARVEEYPFGSDAFVYLQMAKEIRAAVAHGRWPQFRLRAVQTRLLIDFMRARGVPQSAWEELVAPHAHHYFARTGDVGAAPPPGTGLVLAIFPEGRAVYDLNRASLWLFGSVGIFVLFVAGVRERFVSAALGILSIDVGLEILSRIGALSFSVNAVLPTLLVASLVALTAAALRDSERAVWASLVALAAGCLIGLATLIRLPAILLTPGFLVLLWPSSSWKGFARGPIPFVAGVALVGVLPVFLNQQHVAGAWYLPTYSDIDGTMPDQRWIRQNIGFYLGGGLGSLDNWALVVAAVGYVAAAARARGAAADGGRYKLSWFRIAISAFFVWVIPLMFFLTHRIAITYYMVPGVFTAVALLAFGAISRDVTGTSDPATSRPAAILTWLTVAGMLAPGILVLQRTQARLPQTPIIVNPPRLAHPTVILPSELASDHAWIWADSLTGTLYYYARKAAFKIPFGDPSTRLTIYRFIFERGDAQYLIRDSYAMVAMMEEIGRMRGTLQERGTVDGYAYYRILWPKDGPAPPVN